jgi:hypothetical protein
MPTLALALEHPNHFGYLQERQQMIKWILGGALLTLGIIKLADMVQEQPTVGIPLAIVLTVLWMVQMSSDLKAGRK